jgi:hypothetical protein
MYQIKREKDILSECSWQRRLERRKRKEGRVVLVVEEKADVTFSSVPFFLAQSSFLSFEKTNKQRKKQDTLILE